MQGVNALGQMVHDPERIPRAFGSVLDIAEVLEIEPGRFLTFEYIGPTDVFGEVPDGERTRGAQCTSVDAAFLFRTSTGERELALVEWKYTESYRPRVSEPVKDEVRWQRYGTALHDPDGPVRAEHRAVGDTVQAVWHALLRRPDRFLSLDSAVFADPTITSPEYVARYGEKDGSHDQ